MYQPQDVPPHRREERAPSAASKRLATAYCIGAALHSAIITTLFLRFDRSLPLAAWFAQWWVFAWPIVPTLAVVLVLNRRGTLRLTVGYVLIGSVGVAAITLAGQLLGGTINDASFTNVYWYAANLAFTASLPLALLLITGWRRIRAVTPLALSTTLVFGFALLLFRELLTRAFNLEAVRSMVLAAAEATSVEATYYGAFMILVLPVGWVAWRLLQLLATRFESKRFSDVQLIIDCWWLIVTAEALAVHLSSNYGLGGIAAGIAAFGVYRISVALALSRLPKQLDAPAKRLLLLRVFGYQARTETLFDRVAQQWRFHGPVQLIAGVDLAMRTIDPGDMLAFVSGRLDERYIATPDDVSPRLAGLDMQRDPDGRFRVNEVYCRDEAWRTALKALLDMTDTVLMDLRNFSAVNAGCAFELEQIVFRLSPEKIVLIYDQTTDLRLLSEFLRDGWERAGHDRPVDVGSIACVRVERNSWSELRLLMRRLLGLEPSNRVLAVADLASA
jgi:hypothetical protein